MAETMMQNHEPQSSQSTEQSSICAHDASDSKIKEIPSIEKINVVDSYDNIAETFSGTRYKAWPTTVKFVMGLRPSTRCLEVGCGNTKNMIRDDIEMIGIDSSKNLIDIGKARGKKVELGDGCDLRFKDGEFDSVFSIAVLHHVSSDHRRIKFVSEMMRVCAIGGDIMIEVWATTEPKFETSKVIRVNSDEHTSDESSEGTDRLVSFLSRTDNTVYERYYHFFTESEFRRLIDEVRCSNKRLNGKIHFENHNWVFIGKVVDDSPIS